ncbi:hypothetical protein HQ590_01500 [bacterium]|nr:hypothetical protein [bacterium]
MAAAIAAAVLGIMVTGFLAWITNEYRLSRRSHAWSQSLNLCEAGAELALAEFNSYHIRNPNSSFASGRGWSTPSANQRTCTVTNFVDAAGQVVGSFTVTVADITAKYPVIECGATVATGSGPAVTRYLRVIAKKSVANRFALASRREMEVKFTSGILDSFDSSDPNKSTGGEYDPAKAQPNAHIASLSTAIDAILIDKGVPVYGTAATAFGGHVDFGTGASVGATFDGAQRSSTEPTAEAAGWVTHDFVMDIPDVVLPSEFATAPNLGDIAEGTINSGTWRANQIKVDPKKGGDVVINGNVRLYVTGIVQFSDVPSLRIPDGSSLEIYVGGEVSITGSGIHNGSGLAANNQWYGLSTSIDWKLSGDNNFIGVVYAPNAEVKLAGSANFIGAFVGDLMDVSPKNLHYDEALGKSVTKDGYTVLSWQPLVNRGGTWAIETN